MKTVEIQIADNQDVQWIDGVLHLVNIEKKKSGDITERVKMP